MEFDQMHYFGELAMDAAIAEINITDSSYILDIGSGYGGPARYVAWRTGARVTALELQPEVSEQAHSMTELIGAVQVGRPQNHSSTAASTSAVTVTLKDRVDHQVGDVITWVPSHREGQQNRKYDGFMSMLAFLHVSDKDRLFTAIGRSLRSGARFYIEDYFNRDSLNEQDWKVLADIVSCSSLPTREEYIKVVEEAGFADVVFEDKTEDWRDFTISRHRLFRENRADRVQVLGQGIYDALDLFYGSVGDLFSSGRLGGVVLSGTYKGPPSDN
jgi:cyclopropane fatty-acyl-phospholipid synthase-like methyltransferase